jgi:hypothetical protein
MVYPPDYLDGARVLKWAWSGENPFGYMQYTDDKLPPIEVFGLAICRYEDTKELFRFSCDKSWEVVNDSPENSIDNAIENLPQQYKTVNIIWRDK